ncbi:MAG: sigma-70 family RNA polymerase sigma factor [Myxococcales bacterium]|nr:sigma-70 family RNA polymerase sigma factor [Myxococcales bacterium]
MAGHFPTTRWSVVLGAARGAESPRQALHELCAAYRRPLYAFLRRDGLSPEDAEDLVQGFLSSLLSGSTIAGVDRERGRFRSYLLGALRHYLANERARASTLKRGGGQAPVPLAIDRQDAEGLVELRDDRTPEDAYARAWAEEILRRARERLRERYDGDGQAARFDALEPFLLDADTPRYRELAERLAMSEANARVAVHRLRTRFGTALREEVAQTVSSDAEIDDELRAVIEAVRG